MLAALLEQRQQVRYALLAETQVLSSVGTQQALRALEATAGADRGLSHQRRMPGAAESPD